MLRIGLLMLLGQWAVGASLVSVAHGADAPLSSRELDAVPLHVVLPEAVERARALLAPASERGPTRLAIPVPVALDLGAGRWVEEGDDAIWRLRLTSTDASLLTVGFERLTLPPVAEIWLVDATGRIRQSAQRKLSRSADGLLWMPLVPGSEALLELRVPSAQRSGVDLLVGTIGHGIFGLSSNGIAPKAGACNVDAACEGPDWDAPIRSAVLLVSGISGCSGQMVNNSAQNDVPYVLTAAHCQFASGQGGTITAYFNFQASSCGGARDGSLSQNVVGATVRFDDPASDHTLLRLSATPPTSFNAYLSGLDARRSLPSAGRSIHHPNSDEKSISTYDGGVTRSTVTLAGRPTPISAYRVGWTEGVTEQGSSGGGLWNQDQRLIGVLSGGDSSCQSPQADDFYGRLDVAWDNGLDALLDPAGQGSVVPGKAIGGPAGNGGGSGGGDADGGGGGGGGSLGAIATLLMLLAGALRRAAPGLTSRRASRAVKAG